MYKAVISDLDGTLLNDKSKISDFTRETVRKLIDREIKFYIATGRNYGLAKVVMDELGITIPLISANGARINDENGEVIFEDLLGKEEAKKILEVDYRKYGGNIFMNVFSGEDWLVPIGATEYISEEERKAFPALPKEVGEEELKGLEIQKIFFIGEHEALVELEKEIIEKTDGKVAIAFADERCVEFFSETANKANAAKFLLKRDGIDIKDAVSFGDGENDYEMLTMAGKGFIMGNALYRLKNMMPKDFEIIGTNNEDGEAKKLVEIF